MTWLLPLIGGAISGAAGALLLLTHGQLAGISGIFGSFLQAATRDRGWRAAFIAGLMIAGLAARFLAPSAVGPPVRSLPLVAVAGLLVGFGTRLGNGCTSGHGVCGVARLSGRSIVATATFIAAGILTVIFMRIAL